MAGALLLLAAVAAPAAAQAPFVTDDAGVTEPRRFHFELFDAWSDLPAADAPASAQNTVVGNLGYGLATRFELGCDLPWITIADAGEHGASVSGIGDLDLYLKWRVWAGGGRKPALALVSAVELPTGNEENGLGSGVVDKTLNAIAEWAAVGPVDVRANLGVVFAGNSLTGEVGLSADGRIWTGGLSATREGGRLAFGGELTGARAETNRAGARELRLAAGARWTASERLILAAAVQRGWYDAPPWQLQLGIIVDL